MKTRFQVTFFVLLGVILASTPVLTQGDLGSYRLIPNPQPGAAAPFPEANYLRILVKESGSESARIRIHLGLLELFDTQHLQLADGTHLQIRRIIRDLKEQGPKMMGMLGEREGNRIIHLWLER